MRWRRYSPALKWQAAGEVLTVIYQCKNLIGQLLLPNPASAAKVGIRNSLESLKCYWRLELSILTWRRVPRSTIPAVAYNKTMPGILFAELCKTVFWPGHNGPHAGGSCNWYRFLVEHTLFNLESGAISRSRPSLLAPDVVLLELNIYKVEQNNALTGFLW